MPIASRKRILLITGAVVLVIAVGWTGFSTYHYVQHDPGFCTNCHIMTDAFDRWEESVHNQIECHACHAPDLGANLRQLWVYWTEPPEAPRHAPELENSVCYECHHTGDTEHPEATPKDQQWREVLAEAGHAEHVGKQRIQCIRCHSTSLHAFVPPSEICASCHKHNTLANSGMAQHCTSCHPFKAIDDGLLPHRSECLNCHEHLDVGGVPFPDGEGVPMHWDCAKCHKPHSKSFIDSEDCRSCHAAAIAESEIHKNPAHGECLNCHSPHIWRLESRSNCERCHADRDEHYPGVSCSNCHK
jgi:hypothetical protein